MHTKKKHMDDLHFENQLWKTRLAFYEDELKVYSLRLAEVSSKNTDSNIKIKVEQFQNRFYINKNELLKTYKAMRDEELLFAEKAKINTTASDHLLFDDHEGLRVRVETFEAIYMELKEEFTNFLYNNL